MRISYTFCHPKMYGFQDSCSPERNLVKRSKIGPSGTQNSTSSTSGLDVNIYNCIRNVKTSNTSRFCWSVLSDKFLGNLMNGSITHQGSIVVVFFVADNVVPVYSSLLSSYLSSWFLSRAIQSKFRQLEFSISFKHSIFA